MKSSLNLLCIAARFYGPLQNYAAQFGGCGWSREPPPLLPHIVSFVQSTSACKRDNQELHFFALHTDYVHSIFICTTRQAPPAQLYLEATNRTTSAVLPYYAVDYCCLFPVFLQIEAERASESSAAGGSYKYE